MSCRQYNRGVPVDKLKLISRSRQTRLQLPRGPGPDYYFSRPSIYRLGRWGLTQFLPAANSLVQTLLTAPRGEIIKGKGAVFSCKKNTSPSSPTIAPDGQPYEELYGVASSTDHGFIPSAPRPC